MVAAGDPPALLRRRVKNAVLVAPPWRIERAVLHRFARSRVLYPRGALVALVSRPDGTVLWAVSVHLGLGGAERGRHADELVRLCDRLRADREGPIVVGGDLNATPGMAAVRRIAERLRDGWLGRGPGATVPAGAPSARIDYVFVSEDLRVVSSSTGAPGANRASDHLPVVVELEA
jgi:endonuclease/exonuclease/phosphatase family metal-dependent hydrolase